VQEKMTKITDKTKIRLPSDRRYFLFALKTMGEITWMIAVPIVALAIFGKWLDSRYNTSPLFIILGFVLAAILSGLTVSRRAKELGKEYQDLDNVEVEKDNMN